MADILGFLEILKNIIEILKSIIDICGLVLVILVQIKRIQESLNTKKTNNK